MSAVAPQRLLLDALMLPLPQAAEAWRTWRASTDLDDLDRASVHFLPTLAGRMQDWLASDPQQAILRGICRRAWTQNQIRLKLFADALEILRTAGIERVAAIGPVLWAVRYWPDGAIRPIGLIDLLVEPSVVAQALEALSRIGWKIPKRIADTSASKFYFAPGAMVQSPSGGEIRLHWRSLPNTDLSVRRPRRPEFEAMQPGEIAPYAVPAEHSLIGVLGAICEDELDWRPDALMICHHARLDWQKVATLLRRRSKARDRLDELQHDWRAQIPSSVTKSAWTASLEQTVASSLRAYRRYRRST